jgi:subfamily B ATP-binding cassette protein HlyB/CyaB
LTIGLANGGFAALSAGSQKGMVRLVDLAANSAREMTPEDVMELSTGKIVLVARRTGGAGYDPKTFGFQWFLPSIFRYRKPLTQVLVASLFVQVFALVTPLFFQLVIDKVLVHKGLSTLVVLVVGLVTIGVFETVLQYLRAYVLNHTTNRIDVELGRRLFHHLFRLPLAYFETRAAGQTVARVRELETIRSFLTGQGLTSLLDLVFTIVFIAVLFFYSVKLTLVVLGAIPVYILIATLLRPLLREQIGEKFNRGARSQQFLVESIVGAQTLKAAGVEPMIQAQWEDRLAAYVRTSFDATMLGALGQNMIQFVSKGTTALILFLGAQSVIEGQLTVGELIAFNMIAGQVVQPILRLSQLWQDFQQVQVSVERLGDILNAPTESIPKNLLTLPPPQGAIDIRNVSFRYRPDMQDVLHHVNLSIKPGEVIGIVGASGSGKSTLTKLVQRLYSPQVGQVLIDGADVAQLDPGWLRRQIGVVLQENILFNRSIHENIALGDPAMARAIVMHVARLAGADEFISQMPQGYDTIIEERGANLSGGQRQRIAIARALATNPRILILDEATSALDYESERIVQENMQSIVRGRTVIIIAHRLAAVRPCNRIISMRKGEIVEEGSHASLLARNDGLYARLWELQSDQARA